MCDAPSVAIKLSYVGVQMVFEILHVVILGDGSRKFVSDGVQCERQECDGPEFWKKDLL
jgi:hypothetical protein